MRNGHESAFWCTHIPQVFSKQYTLAPEYIFAGLVLRARTLYLVRDEILTHGQCHLNGVGFVSDGDRVHLELVFAVDVVGLGHRVLEHLFIALLAQHGADVHDLGLAAAPCARAGHQEGEENQTHVCLPLDLRGSASCHAQARSMRPVMDLGS